MKIDIPMKKLVLVIFGGLLLQLSSIAQEQPAVVEKINWMTWEEAIEANKTEPKQIFIDVYTEWCGWCKKMDAGTFTEPNIIAYMNKYFYAIKLDAEMKETIVFNDHTFVNPNPEGKRSAHTLAVSLLDSKMSYPSFVILDQGFNRINILNGYQKPEPLMANLLFFGTDQYVRFQQYQQRQQQLRQQAQQQQAQPAPSPQNQADTR